MIMYKIGNDSTEPKKVKVGQNDIDTDGHCNTSAGPASCSTHFNTSVEAWNALNKQSEDDVQQCLDRIEWLENELKHMEKALVRFTRRNLEVKKNHKEYIKRYRRGIIKRLAKEVKK